jgi:hypothetical protein
MAKRFFCFIVVTRSNNNKTEPQKKELFKGHGDGFFIQIEVFYKINIAYFKVILY